MKFELEIFVFVNTILDYVPSVIVIHFDVVNRGLPPDTEGSCENIQ
jgi:hypothetical protein